MPKVKLYGTPHCPWCKKAKDWLNEHSIEFEDINVEEDEEARDYITSKTGQTGVPQIEIDDEVIIGFDEEKLKAKLL